LGKGIKYAYTRANSARLQKSKDGQLFIPKLMQTMCKQYQFFHCLQCKQAVNLFTLLFTHLVYPYLIDYYSIITIVNNVNNNIVVKGCKGIRLYRGIIITSK
jgi:hypothetical protein